jgi:hypothetical protein
VHYRQGDDQVAGSADDRPFRQVADVLHVPGVGRTALACCEAWFTVIPTAFRVLATGRVQSGQGTDRVHRRLAVIDRASRPAQVRYWQSVE